MKVSIDTRTLEPGDIFIPIKGPNHDGHTFIPEAIKKGAKVMDVDLFEFAKSYRKKLKNIPIIAVTGSAGKTTTKDILASILGQKFKLNKTMENQNNEIGAPLTLLRTAFDDEMLIIEMGMRHRGEIKELASLIRPTHVVITSIGLAHIELLKTQRQIALAKSEAFLPALKWETQPRFAFLNFNTPFYDLQHKKALHAGYKVLPFSGETKVDQSLSLYYQVGRHFGLTDQEIQTGIASFHSSSQRLKSHKVGTISLIDDTYNANPDGVLFAMEYIKRYPGRKIVVLGDMQELGAYTQKGYSLIVKEAKNMDIDLLVTLGPKGQAIRTKSISHVSFLDKDDLHQYLLSEIRHGDTVLVKGSRSMKMEETVAFIQQHLG